MPVLGDCTACSGEALDDASGCAHIHPKLGVLLCERCFGRATREFEVDDDGYEAQCRWCGVGGDIVGCDHCISSYCEPCIKRNLGKKVLTAVKKNDDWHCYSCEPSPIKKLRWENVQERSAAAAAKKKPKPAATKKTKSRSAAPEVTRAAKPVAEASAASEDPTVEEPARAPTSAATKAEPAASPKDVANATAPSHESEPMDSTQIKKMKVAELRAELSSRGLSTQGKKDCLLERLLEAVTSTSEHSEASAQQANTEPEAASASPIVQAVAADPAVEEVAEVEDAAAEKEAAEEKEAAADKQAAVRKEAAAEKEAAVVEEQLAAEVEEAAAAVVLSPRRLHSTPKRPAPEPQQESAPAADSPIELMSIGTQDAIAMDGRPSGLISPSQIGQAITSHSAAAPAAVAQQGAGRKRNLDALESELDAEVSERCQLMLSNARALGDALRTKFKTQLARLTKKNRTMTLTDFADTYGVGVEAQIMRDIRRRLAAEGWSEPQKQNIGSDMEIAPTPVDEKSTSVTSTGAMPPPQSIPAMGASKENMPPPRQSLRRSTRAQSISGEQVVPNTPMGLKTPAFDSRLPFTPATAGRCARRGESLMSANGSPLAVFGGARATFGINDGADAVPVIQVALRGGQEVDLTHAEDAAGLSSDAREEARDKLQAMQDQLQVLLQALA